MKQIQFFSMAIAGLAVIFGSTFVFAAAAAPCQEELQFFGKVRNTQDIFSPVSGTVCTYQVEVLPYPQAKPSMVCPLSESKASLLVFTDETCRLEDGAHISGIMVYSNGKAWIE